MGYRNVGIYIKTVETVFLKWHVASGRIEVHTRSSLVFFISWSLGILGLWLPFASVDLDSKRSERNSALTHFV